ncbi:hypothetical protein B0H21DRAFT_369989 [Amylocystis lapponica]|nr:hypothetical protein B0H21DRAFT_369989 [Amylocystis lapponica]
MPVTFKVAAHSANPLQTGIGVDNDSPRSLLRAACEEELNANRRYDIIQSSVSEAALPTLQPRPNGFVHTVMQAYATHHHLKIRPDDVWIAILSQLNIYVNTHAEALRNSFVPHTGQKRLTVWASGDVVDFGSMAHQMTDQIRQNLLDETLVDWILPDFTTTDFVDTTVCSILMMSTLKAYFKYEMGIICGIPSVTLDGEKMDWVKLLERLDRLDELGTEAGLWAAMLRPILMRFVSAFDGKPDVAFWGNVMHRDGSICGLDLLSGWITAFCVWSSEGVWQGGNPVPSQPEAPGKAASQSSFIGHR